MNPVTGPRLALAVAVLAALLACACRDNDDLAGTYAARSHEDLALVLKDNGEGEWRMGFQVAPFTWAASHGEITLHTNHGGALRGTRHGGTIVLAMPDGEDIAFDREDGTR